MPLSAVTKLFSFKIQLQIEHFFVEDNFSFEEDELFNLLLFFGISVDFIYFFNEEYNLFSSHISFSIIEYEIENVLSPKSSSSNLGFSLS